MSSRFSKYDFNKTKQSKYCYAGSDVLINKQNIRDIKKLADFEADMTMLRQYELEKENLIKGKFGITHLKRIHKYIFQDIYPFAGKLRTEDIFKNSTEFCKSEFIEGNLASILSGLKDEGYLKGLNAKEFSEKAAYYMSEINMVHPFREGNGRIIREFIRQLALNCGYIIDWARIDRKSLLEAIIVAVNKEYNLLTDCIFQAIENK